MSWEHFPLIEQLFDASLLASVSDDWGQQYFHPSDATTCSRAIAYRMALAADPTRFGGYTPPIDATQQMTFFTGHALHERLQHYLVEVFGWCTWEDIEVRVTALNDRMTGRADAVLPSDRLRALCEKFGLPPIETTGSHVLLDFKTKKDEVQVWRVAGGKRSTHTFPSSIQKYPDLAYTVQLQLYMELLPLCYPERYTSIEFGIDFYLCKNDGRRHAVIVRRDPTVLTAVLGKARDVLTHVDAGTLPPREYEMREGTCSGWVRNDEAHYGCPYAPLCWGCG